MTIIYAPNLEDGWEWATPQNESDNGVFRQFGKSLNSSWKPIEMQLLRNHRGRKLNEADLPWYGEHAPILRPKAVAALRELCLESGELLPLKCKDADLVVWNVTREVDALDHEQSVLSRFSSGKVMHIKKYVFRPEVVAGLNAFRIPETRATIFLGSAVVDRARSAHLTGATFKKIWSS